MMCLPMFRVKVNRTEFPTTSSQKIVTQILKGTGELLSVAKSFKGKIPLLLLIALVSL